MAYNSNSISRTRGRILGLVASAGYSGLTVAEIRDVMTDEHHGTISGSLSHLHKADEITRLSQKRGGCKIYVLPGLAGGRATERQGR